MFIRRSLRDVERVQLSEVMDLGGEGENSDEPVVLLVARPRMAKHPRSVPGAIGSQQDHEVPVDVLDPLNQEVGRELPVAVDALRAAEDDRAWEEVQRAEDGLYAFQ